MKVSVIIPVYNTAPYIERCLYSVLRQSYKNMEIILVDDHGMDNSMVLATRLLETPSGENANLRSLQILHHQENRGLSAARNTGIDAATGDYVFFLDSDDEIPPRAIENLIHTAKLYSNPHLVCGSVDVRPEGKTALRINDKMPAYIEGKQSSSGAILKRDIPIMACNKLVDRQFLMSNLLYFKEGLIHEDNLWSFQMAGCVHHIAVTRQITYIYHLNKRGLTLERITPQRIESIKTILTLQIESLSRERPLRTLQQAYIFFTAAWFTDLLYEQTHPELYTMQQWIRTTLRPFNREIHYHTLTNRLLYRALYLSPGVLQAGKKFRNSVLHKYV